MAEAAKWYVVHTYSGYENTVKATIEKSVENRHLEDLIHQVLIPMETVTEVTDNGTKTVERKVYPGYVLVKMVMTDRMVHRQFRPRRYGLCGRRRRRQAHDPRHPPHR